LAFPLLVCPAAADASRADTATFPLAREKESRKRVLKNLKIGRNTEKLLNIKINVVNMKAEIYANNNWQASKYNCMFFEINNEGIMQSAKVSL
jgi:hypothetical protein